MSSLPRDQFGNVIGNAVPMSRARLTPPPPTPPNVGMGYGNSQFRRLQQALSASRSPFANSIRQAIMPTQTQRAMPTQRSAGGLGALFGGRFFQGNPQTRQGVPLSGQRAQKAAYDDLQERSMRGPLTPPPLTPPPPTPPQEQRMTQAKMMDQMFPTPLSEAPQVQREAPQNTPQFDPNAFNSFMGGLDDSQRNMIQAFAGRQSQDAQRQMQQVMRQRQQQMRNPYMGMGIGGARPMGMQPYQGFGRPQFPMQQPMQQRGFGPNPNNYGGYGQQQRQVGAMGYNQPMQQPRYQPQPMQQYGGMMGGYQQNPYQQQRPQPQQFGGYGMGQNMGGYGGYGGMSNPYQPQQYGAQNQYGSQYQQFGR